MGSKHTQDLQDVEELCDGLIFLLEATVLLFTGHASMYGKSRKHPLPAAVEAREQYPGVWLELDDDEDEDEEEDDDDGDNDGTAKNRLLVNTNRRLPIFEVDGGLNTAKVTTAVWEVSVARG